jgi:hypothetical protein
MRRVGGLGLALALLAGASPGPAAAQFGAKFEPPVGRILHGVGQDGFSTAAHNKVPEYEAAMGPGLAPAIDKTYLTLSLYLRSPRNPRAGFLTYLGKVAPTGKVPEIGIDILPDQDVVAGLYDADIRQMAQDFRGFARPIYARLGVEIANSWNAYSAKVFPRAWRRFVDIFRSEGAHNVAFLWCFAAAGNSDFADFDGQGNGLWYPGDEYVDWIGLDLFNATDFSYQTTPGKSYQNAVALCDFALRRRKPVMIAECTAKGLGLTSQGNAQTYWSAWFQPFFAFLAARPVIREFSYINWDWSQTSKWPTWLNADITVNPALTTLYKQELARSLYLHKSTGLPFAGPYPAQGHVQARNQPIPVRFAGLKPGTDVILGAGLQRLVLNPAAGEKDRIYGADLRPIGFLKFVPFAIANLGQAPASGELALVFPAQSLAGTIYLQVMNDGRLSTEMRVDY